MVPKNIRDIVSEGNDVGDEIAKRENNALYFPWAPIEGIDMIASEKFTSSKDIELAEENIKPGE